MYASSDSSPHGGMVPRSSVQRAKRIVVIAGRCAAATQVAVAVHVQRVLLVAASGGGVNYVARQTGDVDVHLSDATLQLQVQQHNSITFQAHCVSC